MRNSLALVFSNLLSYSPVSRIRRNHGLEHATLHVLAGWLPQQPLAGYSDWRGFWILGEVSTPVLEQAVRQALAHLQNGRRQLALHPNCGTNLAASGLLAGLGAFVALAGSSRSRQSRWERLPLAVVLATLGLVISRPLGLLLQREVTTSGEPGDLQVERILAQRRGNLRLHRILTTG